MSCILAQCMFKHTRSQQQDLNKKALNLFTLLDKNDTTERDTIQLQFDRHNKTLMNEDKKFVQEYYMFINDLQVLFLVL